MSTRDIVKKDPADFTPTLGNYKDLQPFRFWCQKVLPLVYDDSLSYYELLCKVVDYLNKTMEDVGVLEGDVTGLHEAYKKLQGYVNDYFSALDVQEEINKKLDAMVKDGTLDTILARIPRFSSFEPILMGRTWGLATERNHAQGGCCIDKNTVVYARTTIDPNSDVTLLTEVDTLNEEVRREIQLPIGHADDMTYIPDSAELIVAPSTHEPNGTNWNSLLVIDYATFTIKKEINTNINFTGVCYDRENKKLYVKDRDIKIYEFDLNTEKETFLFQYTGINPSKFVKQGFSCYMSRFYFATAYPNNIISFSLTGETLNVLNIPITTIENYLFGELEWCDVVGTNMYFGSSITTPSGKYELSYIWYTNIINGAVSRLRGGFDPISTIHVDSAYTGMRANGSTARPFPTIDEAMLYDINRRTLEVTKGDYDGQVFGWCRILANNESTLKLTVRNGECTIDGAKEVNGTVLTGGTLTLRNTPVGSLENNGIVYSDTQINNISGSGVLIPIKSSIVFKNQACGFARCRDNRNDLGSYLTIPGSSKMVIFNGNKTGVNYTKVFTLNAGQVNTLISSGSVTINVDGEALTIKVTNGVFSTDPVYTLEACFIYN